MGQSLAAVCGELEALKARCSVSERRMESWQAAVRQLDDAVLQDARTSGDCTAGQFMGVDSGSIALQGYLRKVEADVGNPATASGITSCNLSSTTASLHQQHLRSSIADSPFTFRGLAD